MTDTFAIADLDIIGFASTVEAQTLPRVLAPVFCLRAEPGRVLLPPFTIRAGEVWKAHAGTQAEFDEFVARKKLTPLDAPIPAKADHDLWVNPEGVVAYEAKTKVKKAFADLYEEHLKQGERELAAKNYDAAYRHAAVASAVAPGKLDPLILRGAVERLRGEDSPYRFTRHIATDIVKAGEFDRLVQDRISADLLVQVHDQDSTERACIVSASTRGAQAMRGAVSRPTRFRTTTAVARPDPALAA